VNNNKITKSAASLMAILEIIVHGA